MQTALDRVRYPHQVFATLTMSASHLLGSLRQLQAHRSLRDQVQSLMYIDNDDKPPLARSTWSDALASKKSVTITRQAFEQLVAHARTALPERFTDMPNLGDRSVIAIDASYQTESVHYHPIYPMDGGTDNSKGPMLMT